MSPKRIKQRFDDFEKALRRLKEAMDDDPQKSSAIIDGTIQRFEFTFELAWKLAQDILHHNGIESSTPRGVIKEAFQKNFIQEGESWIQMLDDRNRTSHIYDEEEALSIYQRIKELYYHLFCDFRDNMRSQSTS